MLRYVDKRHADSQYEDELKSLIDKLNSMRELVMDQFEMLKKLLEEKAANGGVKSEAREIDREINTLQEELDKAVHSMLVRHSPQLVELRFILSASKLAGQFERMGDHCKNSIKRFCRSEGKMSEDMHERLIHLVTVASPVLESLEGVLLHFDDVKAREAFDADDAVDKAFKKFVIKMPKVMDDDAIENEAISDILFISKNIERLADHATEIIREAYYIHNGKRMPYEV